AERPEGGVVCERDVLVEGVDARGERREAGLPDRVSRDGHAAVGGQHRRVHEPAEPEQDRAQPNAREPRGSGKYEPEADDEGEHERVRRDYAREAEPTRKTVGAELEPD